MLILSDKIAYQAIMLYHPELKFLKTYQYIDGHFNTYLLIFKTFYSSFYEV